MNKKVAALACVGLAAVLCVPFAACGGKNPEDIKGEEITKEEWVAAFADDNFTNVKIEQKMVEEGKEDGEEGKESMSYTIIIDGNKAYLKIVTETSGEVFDEEERGEETKEYYYEKTDSAVKTYAKGEDDKWAESNQPGMNAFTMLMGVLQYKNMFDEFEFNADKKGYTVKSDSAQADHMEGYVLKFTDKKFVAVWSEESEEDGEDWFKSTLSVLVTYGGQSVTLPTIG